MLRIIFIAGLFLFYTNCMAQFTEEDKVLINSGDESTPFRVLTVDNEADSLFLRQQCSDIDFDTDAKDLKLFIARLKKTMEVSSGVGIAAPQVGIGKNIFIFRRIDQEGYPAVAAINPKIVNYPDETICFERDGCLSIPGLSGNSVRYPWVDVEYTDENGNKVVERLQGYSRTDDFTGIIFQHEFDHLQGILYIDKLCPETPTE